MSRIGKQPIDMVSGVDVSVDAKLVSIKGPKGELSTKILKGLAVEIKDDKIIVTQKEINADTQKQFGLQRTLIANMIIGVSEGFTKELEINGVGYRAKMNGKDLEMSLGFSHPVIFTAPEGVTVTVNQNIITVAGYDKQQVGAYSKSPSPIRAKA